MGTRNPFYERMGLDPNDRNSQRCWEIFDSHFDQFLEMFPLIGILWGVSESEDDEESLREFTRILFDAIGVEEFYADRDFVRKARRILAGFAEMLTDERFAGLRDPQWLSWIVFRSLCVELTASSPRVSLFGVSRKVQILREVVDQCARKYASKRTLPKNIRTLMRSLEEAGVALNADLYDLARFARKYEKRKAQT